MLTDSSAEASALGSGPRGRRFKSALSEKHENDYFLSEYKDTRRIGCFLYLINSMNNDKKHEVFIFTSQLAYLHRD